MGARLRCGGGPGQALCGRRTAGGQVLPKTAENLTEINGMHRAQDASPAQPTGCSANAQTAQVQPQDPAGRLAGRGRRLRAVHALQRLPAAQRHPREPAELSRRDGRGHRRQYRQLAVRPPGAAREPCADRRARQLDRTGRSPGPPAGAQFDLCLQLPGACRRRIPRASALRAAARLRPAPAPLVQGCRGRRPDHADRALRGCGDQRADHHRSDPGAGRRPDPWRDRRGPEPEGAGRHHQLARLQRHGPCVSRQCRRQDPRPPGQDQGQQDAERALPAEHPEPDQPLRRGEPRRQRAHPRLQPGRGPAVGEVVRRHLGRP